MKTFVFFCAILACATAAPVDKCTSEQYAEYLEYKIEFEKTEVATNEDEKCLIWLKSVIDVEACNENPNTHNCSMNDFSDLTDAEKNELYGFLDPTDHQEYFEIRAAADKPPTLDANIVLPDAVDWRTVGAVSPVKAQLSCGSCWAFSSVGVIEGQNFIKTKQMTTFSEQQMVDCTPQNSACKGGWMVTAFEAVKSLGGIYTNDSYPYNSGTSKTKGTCQFDAEQTSNIGAKIASVVVIPVDDQLALKAAVATIGPIAVTFDATNIDDYKIGVYSDPSCRQDKPTHAVLIVGYGTDEKGVDYWIVKNSWGPKWGDNGYIHIPRNVTEANKGLYSDCGITQFASYVLLE